LVIEGILFALVGLVGIEACIILIMCREHREERRSLVNHILSKSSSEFAAMQYGEKMKPSVAPGVYPSMTPEQEAKISDGRGQAPVVLRELPK
jgi:hypothetical protein